MNKPSADGLSELMRRGELFSAKCPSREILRHVTSQWGVLVLVALMVLTSHHASPSDRDPWPSYIPPNVTLVVYMPGYAYEVTRNKLLRAGISANTPCAVISQATSPEEHVFRTTVKELHLTPHFPAPTLLVVGDVVRFADHATLRKQFGQFESALETEQNFVVEQEQAE